MLLNLVLSLEQTIPIPEDTYVIKSPSLFGKFVNECSITIPSCEPIQTSFILPKQLFKIKSFLKIHLGLGFQVDKGIRGLQMLNFLLDLFQLLEGVDGL